MSGWDAFFVAQLLLDHEDAVASLDVESDLFPARRGHEDLHCGMSSREEEPEEKRRTQAGNATGGWTRLAKDLQEK